MVKQNSNSNAGGDASRSHELLGNEVTVIPGRKAKSAFWVCFFKHENNSKSNETYKTEVSLSMAPITTEANVCGFICSAL